MLWNFESYKRFQGSPYKGTHFSNKSKRGRTVHDGDDLFEGLDGGDEDIDFAEFI